MSAGQPDHTMLGAVRMGIDGVSIEIQARFLGKPGKRSAAWDLDVAGLPGAEVRECVGRLTGAFAKWGYEPPLGPILINLAPAGLPKYGTSLDLPIALISLQAAGYLRDWPEELERRFLFFGEVGIHGEVRRVDAALPIVHAVRPGQTIVCPEGNGVEAAMIRAVPRFNSVTVGVVRSLDECVKFLQGRQALRSAPVGKEAKYMRATQPGVDLSKIKGQARAKRALEIAAAGGHNVLMVGPPGEGKSLLASAMPTILPPLELEEKVELTKIFSAKGLIKQDGQIVTDRPFRMVHHTASRSALVGGGSRVPDPGEISLAHRGVLFLDELPEFPRSLLEALRQPMEAGRITLSRVGGTLEFPAQFTLVAAMNPCPCGFAGQYECADCLNMQPSREGGCLRCGSIRLSERCHCQPAAVSNYRKKLSGPLLDRIDMKVEVAPLDVEEKLAASEGELSRSVRERVVAARERQRGRFDGTGIPFNAAIPGGEVSNWCQFDTAGTAAYRHAVATTRLSTRASDKMAKLARTIADLERNEKTGEADVHEALGLLGVGYLS